MRNCFLPPKIAERLADELGHPVDLDASFRNVRRSGLTVRTPAGIYTANHEEVEPGTRLTLPYTNVAAIEAADGLAATTVLLHAVGFTSPLGGDVATVNYGQGYDNAFYDGSEMVFGDGDGVLFTRFTRAVDVCAHELCHGVTAETGPGLDYDGESGALNESLSDAFGATARQLRLGLAVSDPKGWLIGADILGPGIQGRGLRDMLHPGTAFDDPKLGKDDQPDRYSDYVRTSGDNGGVHTNSGIPNRAFAVAAFSLGDSVKTLGIWHRALRDLPTAKPSFRQFAEATVAAAGQDAAVVANAWAVVEVLHAPTPGGGGASLLVRLWRWMLRLFGHRS